MFKSKFKIAMKNETILKLEKIIKLQIAPTSRKSFSGILDSTYLIVNVLPVMKYSTYN